MFKDRLFHLNSTRTPSPSHICFHPHRSQSVYHEAHLLRRPSHRVPCLEDFPDELLVNVCEPLACKERRSLALTSKRMHRLANPLLYREVWWNAQYSDLLVHTFQRRSDLAQSVNIINIVEHCCLNANVVPILATLWAVEVVSADIQAAFVLCSICGRSFLEGLVFAKLRQVSLCHLDMQEHWDPINIIPTTHPWLLSQGPLEKLELHLLACSVDPQNQFDVPLQSLRIDSLKVDQCDTLT